MPSKTVRMYVCDACDKPVDYGDGVFIETGSELYLVSPQGVSGDELMKGTGEDFVLHFDCLAHRAGRQSFVMPEQTIEEVQRLRDAIAKLKIENEEIRRRLEAYEPAP